MEIPVLKKNADDFLVNESFLLPKLANLKKSIFCYYWLRKCGFTTFEAVEKIANYLNVNQDCIQYAGLKDEDGITEQLIAIKPIVFSEQLKQFNKDNEDSLDKFIVLSFYGYGNEAINIGQLNGNAFRLVVRNLSENFFDKFKGLKKINFYFVNYYDIQRFGMSNCPKMTHWVGKELLNNDNKAAFEVLKKLCTPESIKALNFKGNPELFFNSLNHRITTFYKNSYSSYLWNIKLIELLKDICIDDYYKLSYDNLDFIFTEKQEHILSFLNKNKYLEFTKYFVKEAQVCAGISFRPTVIQTQIIFHSLEKDDLYKNAYKCDISFFLPSGCYATTCVKQMVNTVDILSPQ